MIKTIIRVILTIFLMLQAYYKGDRREGNVIEWALIYLIWSI